MKSMWCKGLLIALAWSTQVKADETAQIMMDLTDIKLDSLEQIRVKIFPHDRDYKPQGLEAVRDRLVVESEKPCALFRAAADRTQAIGGVRHRANRFTFTLADLAEPKIVQCPGPYRVLRQGLPANLSYEYTGRLYLHTVDGRQQKDIEAINLIDLNQYLRGVVPSEVYREWPMETLKTQAVAARTYAVYHVVYGRHYQSERLWDVDDTINYQAYTGTTLHNPRTDEAVLQTAGQILTYQGQVIQAYYHADSGGQTEEARSVWNRAVPFTVARPEAGDVELTKTIWEREVSLLEIEKDLIDLGLLEADQTIKQLLVPVIGRTLSGRVRSLVVVDQRGTFKLIPFSVFRRVVPQLPSQLFAIERSKENPQNVLIRGIGNGHGVGMSQIGAAALAGEKAWTYQQILEYYYVRTTLCTLKEVTDVALPSCAHERTKYAGDGKTPVAQPPI